MGKANEQNFIRSSLNPPGFTKCSRLLQPSQLRPPSDLVLYTIWHTLSSLRSHCFGGISSGLWDPEGEGQPSSYSMVPGPSHGQDWARGGSSEHKEKQDWGRSNPSVRRRDTLEQVPGPLLGCRAYHSDLPPSLGWPRALGPEDKEHEQQSVPRSAPPHVPASLSSLALPPPQEVFPCGTTPH